MLMNPGKILIARRSIHNHAVVVVCDVVDDQVVDDTTGFVEHARVQRLAVVLEPRHVVREQVAQEVTSALALQVDDGHVRYVEHAGLITHGMMLFLLRTVVQRHVPATEIDDPRSGLEMLFVMWCFQTHEVTPKPKKGGRRHRLPPLCPR